MAAVQAKYRKSFKTGSSGGGYGTYGSGHTKNDEADRAAHRLANDVQDKRFGFEFFRDGPAREGWLTTFSQTTYVDPSTNAEHSCVHFYFVQQNGAKFKAAVRMHPYILLGVQEGREKELPDVEAALRRLHSDYILDTQQIQKNDLDQPNHLSGIQRKLLKLTFRNTKDLLTVRKEVQKVVQANQDRIKTEMTVVNANQKRTDGGLEGALDSLTDMREFDVAYHLRLAIDKELRVGKWYSVSVEEGFASLAPLEHLDKKIGRAEPRVFAWDIECTKKPLKFPDAQEDEVFMISYMVDGQGYLIINREVVSEDVHDFEYTPKPEYEGPFEVFNDVNEEELLRRFVRHIQTLKPDIFVTFNGDYFDWPFVDTRCLKYGISLEKEIGFKRAFGAQNSEEWRCRFATHIDCLCWVKRDSYLPQGSHGLKAVTRAKLGYKPVEVDPEEMVAFAQSDPQTMASYSVSDAVATYYLYMKYVHPFIFSLCNIIPMTPDDVLRKGSGTLCETLLMVEAFRANVVCPNKSVEEPLRQHKGKVLDSETYVGGHVEALQSGVFHAKIKYKFNMNPHTLQELIDSVDRDLKYALEVQSGVKMEDVLNYDEVREEIVKGLEDLRDTPRRKELPVIIHVDVGAMYPNIILTNRLQPPAMVSPQTCASCSFFSPDMNCRREMPWVWRAESFPASVGDVRYVKDAAMRQAGGEAVPTDKLRKEIRKFCQRVHKRQHVTLTEQRTAYICQRENSFYVDTVNDFKERRYVYKAEKKKAEAQLEKAEDSGDALAVQTAEKMCVLYESLQLAHKCILNSFYGYVMRRGARWYSMEMAGAVTHSGAGIIKMAKDLVDNIGIPLELDTDGLWCALPRTFPQGVVFKAKDHKKGGTKNVKVSYACEMLNAMVDEKYSNLQYHVLDKKTGNYSVEKRNSIYFEIDGPYLAMILPASKDEGKKLKKRYAVFNFNGSLAELKGFEIKRRGELQLIKVFQEGVFKKFLVGSSLPEVFNSVASVANEWLDVLDNQGEHMEDDDLVDLISESSVMSRPLADYDGQKSCPITCARRLGDFLGPEMVSGKGTACKFVISRLPLETPVTERSVPTAIFSAPIHERLKFLKLWVDPSIGEESCDIRDIVDWNYYRERLSNTIRKIVTIPAAFQGVENPVPRVIHPDWLQKALYEHKHGKEQMKMTQLFQKAEGPQPMTAWDIEDGGIARSGAHPKHAIKGKAKKSRLRVSAGMPEAIEPPPPALRYSNYRLWLQKIKNHWRADVAQRRHKRQKLGLDIPGSIIPKLGGAAAGGTMRGFLAQRHRDMLAELWQILEMEPSAGNPGQLNCWVLWRSGSLENIRMIVPKMLYINCTKADPAVLAQPGIDATSVRKRPPFGRPLLHMWELQLPSSDPQQLEASVQTLLCDKDVEGVYESQTPFDFRAIVNVGACCRMNRRGVAAQQIIQGNSVGTIHLADIVPSPEESSNYMTDMSGIKLVLVKLACIRDGETGQILRAAVGVWTGVGQQSDGLDNCKIDVVELGSTRTNVEEYAQRYSLRRTDLGEFAVDSIHLPSSAKFVKHLLSPDAGESGLWQAVNRLIQKYIDSKPGPVMMVFQQPISDGSATLSKDVLRTVIPCSQSMPITLVPQITAGSEKLSYAVVDGLLEAPHALSVLVELAKYTKVPVANMPIKDAQVLSFATDVLFARHLAAESLLSWFSYSWPDVGGHEVALRSMSSSPLESTVEMMQPGSYRHYCVSLELGNLAMAAVKNLHQIEEVSVLRAHSAEFSESGDDHMLFQNGQQPASEILIDESVASLSALKSMETMLSVWLKNHHKEDSVVAQQLTNNFMQWLNGAHGGFATRIIRQHVGRLMNKLFDMLVSKVASCGAQIIYGTYSKLVILTKSTSLQSAQNFVDFLVNELASDEMFEHLHLCPMEYWSWFVLLDGRNYGGYLTHLADVHSGESSVFSQRPTAIPGVAAHWALCSMLPFDLQSVFTDAISKFLLRPFDVREQRKFDIDISQAMESHRTSSQALAGQHDSPISEDELQYLIEMVDSSSMTSGSQAALTKLLLEAVRGIRGDMQWPDIPSKKRHQNQPAVALVVWLCQILSLEPAVADKVQSMKRQLLKMLQVRDFSQQSTFSDPTRSLVLPSVCCPTCYFDQDIDICRDHTAVTRAWRCINCGDPLSVRAIESQLLSLTQELNSQVQTQDVRCRKCKREQVNPVSDLCTCSSKFEPILTSQQAIDRLRTIHEVAKCFNFQCVEACADWGLQRA